MKPDSRKKTIGIIGGMGPQGTADLYMKIIKYYQDNLGARYDADFPRIIIYSIPLPDVVESVENEKLTLKMLSQAAGTLEGDGCDFAIIACNTVQFLLGKIRNSVKIPILGIAETSAEFVKSKGYGKVGILATETTIKKGVYERPFRNIGVELVKPGKNDQGRLTSVIMAQLAGRATKNDRETLKQITDRLREAGVEAVLIACTDLPPLLGQKEVRVPLLDCGRIYADEAARMSAAGAAIGRLKARP